MERRHQNRIVIPAEGSKYSHIHPTKGGGDSILQKEKSKQIEQMELDLLNGMKSYSYCYQNTLEKNGIKKEAPKKLYNIDVISEQDEESYQYSEDSPVAHIEEDESENYKSNQENVQDSIEDDRFHVQKSDGSRLKFGESLLFAMKSKMSNNSTSEMDNSMSNS